MLTIIESPYAGDVDRNLAYLRDAIADCVRRGESPYASHWMIAASGALNDLEPDERKRGIELGFLWLRVADKQVFYVDLGLSSGMLTAMARGVVMKKTIEIRSLEKWKNEDTYRWTAAAEGDLESLLEVKENL